MRGLVVSILFFLVSAQIEATVCSHFSENQSMESSVGYNKVNDEDCSGKNRTNELPSGDVCLTCGHLHLIFFGDTFSSFKFLNNDERLLDLQNEVADSRSVQPPIDPPRAELA